MEDYRTIKIRIYPNKLQEEIILNAKINANNMVEKSYQKTLVQEQEIKSSLEKIYKSQEEKYKKLNKFSNPFLCIITSWLFETSMINLIHKVRKGSK